MKGVNDNMGTVSIDYSPDCLGCRDLSKIDPSFNAGTPFNEIINALNKDQATFLVCGITFADTPDIDGAIYNSTYPDTRTWYHDNDEYSAYVEIDTKSSSTDKVRVATISTCENNIYRKRYSYTNTDPSTDKYRIGKTGPGGIIYGDLNGDGVIDTTDVELLAKYVRLNNSTGIDTAAAEILTNSTVARYNHKGDLVIALCRYISGNTQSKTFTQEQIHTLHIGGINSNVVIDYIAGASTLTDDQLRTIMSAIYPSVSEYNPENTYRYGDMIYRLVDGVPIVYSMAYTDSTIPTGSTFKILADGEWIIYTTTIDIYTGKSNVSMRNYVIPTNENGVKGVDQCVFDHGSVTTEPATIVSGNPDNYTTMYERFLTDTSVTGEFDESRWTRHDEFVIDYNTAVTISEYVDSWRCATDWIRLTNDARPIYLMPETAAGSTVHLAVGNAYNEIRVNPEDGGFDTCSVEIHDYDKLTTASSFSTTVIVPRAETSTASTLVDFFNVTGTDIICVNGYLDISGATHISAIFYWDGQRMLCIGSTYTV